MGITLNIGVLDTPKEPMDEDELFARLEAEMGDLPCEVPSHGRSNNHDGPGIWYMTTPCPHCKDGPPRILVCDRYKQLLPVLLVLKGDIVVECEYCREIFLGINIICEFERREP